MLGRGVDLNIEKYAYINVSLLCVAKSCRFINGWRLSLVLQEENMITEKLIFFVACIDKQMHNMTKNVMWRDFFLFISL